MKTAQVKRPDWYVIWWRWQFVEIRPVKRKKR